MFRARTAGVRDYIPHFTPTEINMKKTSSWMFVALIGIVSAGLTSAGCGSSSTNNTGGAGSGGSTGSAGRGGTTGSAGTTGTGGLTGAAGTTGTGGVGADCVHNLTMTPAMALITDFSDTAAGTAPIVFTYGGTGRVMGGATTFKNPASPAGTLAVSGGAATFTAMVSMGGGTTAGADQYPYNGFVIYINGPACTDATAYSGVSFKISGSLGTCALVFSFNDSEHTTVASDAMRGVAADGSYSPQFTIPAAMVGATAMTVTVPFTSPTGGSPATAVDKTKITGVQWQFGQANTATTACSANITIDDVTFVQ
jgi:hypothetical protein